VTSQHGGSARPHAVIVGAGVAGLASALALSRREFSVEILEARAQSPSDAFKGELLHPRGVQLLRSWGIAPDDLNDVQTCRGLVVSCESTRDQVLLDYEPGSPGLIARHDVWLSALQDQLAICPNVTTSFGNPVDDVIVENGCAKGVRLRTDELRLADLTVIAAGRSSRLPAVAGISATRRITSRTEVITLWGVDLPRPNRGHLFLGGPGPVLAYHIEPHCVRICVDLPGMRDVEGNICDVRSAFSAHLPSDIVSALARQEWADSARRYPNVSTRLSHRWPRSLAVVGDTASCSHPLTASGMTRAFLQANATAQRFRPSGGRLVALAPAREMSRTTQSAVVADAFEQVCSGLEPAGPVMRAGLFRYLRNPRSRRAALGLVTGQNLSTIAAAREYGVLMSHSLRHLARSGEFSGCRGKVVTHMLRSTAHFVRELVQRCS
jgi:squalene monooxygenase